MTTVYIVTSPRTRKVYHSNPDCNHLTHTQRPVPFDNLTDEWRECSYCADTAESGGGPNEIYRAALEAGDTA